MAAAHAAASSAAGQSTAAAAASTEPDDVEYHRSDFAFEELVADGERFVASAVARRRADADAAALAYQSAARSKWNDFYNRHHHRFFKPRHYLLREFPQLLALASPSAVARILEVGAGNGSNVFTLLDKLPPHVTVFACDLCASSLRAIVRAPQFEPHRDGGRLTCFLYDASIHAAPELPASATLVDAVGDVHTARGGVVRDWMVLPAPVRAGEMDAVLCMFILSALHPSLHAAAVRNLASTLRPGASLCFRDYALYDLAMLRAPDAHILTPQLHVRGDGTLAYFFSVEEVRALLEGAGLIVEELEYTCIVNRNRKLGIDMKRVWVHARAVKPDR